MNSYTTGSGTVAVVVAVVSCIIVDLGPRFAIVSSVEASDDIVTMTNRSTNNCPLNACEVLVYISQHYFAKQQQHQTQQQQQSSTASSATSSSSFGGNADNGTHDMLDVMTLERELEGRIRAVERRLRSVEQPGKTQNIHQNNLPSVKLRLTSVIWFSVAPNGGQRCRMDALRGRSMSLLGVGEKSELLESALSVGAAGTNGSDGYADNVNIQNVTSITFSHFEFCLKLDLCSFQGFIEQPLDDPEQRDISRSH